MRTIGVFLKELRISRNLTIKDLTIQTGIDQGLISRYESGSRIASKKHIDAFIGFFGQESKDLRKLWLADKLVELVKYELAPLDIFEVAESRIEYLQSTNNTGIISLSYEFEIELECLTELKDQWIKGKPLNTLQLNKLNEYFNNRYTFESNQIEGNTLSFQETTLVINEGLTIGGKSMREHLEAVNHSEAIQFILDLAYRKVGLTKRNLLEIHYLVLKSIDPENAGCFRKVPVRISGSTHLPPQPDLIDKMMEDFFLFYEQHKHNVHPIILAAEMHERLVSIHPFIDGNGRTSRLIMNLILLSHGYTITSLKGDASSRMNYFRALEAVQKDNRPDLFHSFIMKAVKESLVEHLEMI